MAEDFSRSACGEYPHCWSCGSFSLTLESWHEPVRRFGRYMNEFLSGVPADRMLFTWNPSQRKEAIYPMAPSLDAAHQFTLYPRAPSLDAAHQFTFSQVVPWEVV